MEKEEKSKKKFKFALDSALGLALFIPYRIGIETGAKWAFVLLLVLSVAIFVMGKYTETTFLKVLAVGNILYSLMALTFNENWWESVFDGKLTRILPVTVLVMIGVVMARISGLFVFLFGFLLGMGIPYIPGIVTSIAKGPLPKVQSVVKGSKRVHLYTNYEKRQTELIYRQGYKKKILDVYPWEEDSKFHASLEWKEKDCVIVRSYSIKTYQLLEEKKYEL